MRESSTMLRLLAALGLLGVVLGSTSAQGAPWGQYTLVGATLTPATKLDGQRVPFGGFRGPTLEVGYEFGEYFNHQLSILVSFSEGRASAAGHPAMLQRDVLAGGYHLTLDMLGKGGFTPYLGGGVFYGVNRLQVEVPEPYATRAAETGHYLDVRGVVGLRHTFESGIGLKAQVAYGTGNGFPGLQAGVGVACQF
ncbi:MAG TPA: hypothetical protein VLQ93_22015 [Myxococcaceae bacterium]|nr:hypothetical protein [Myxococcaceae bacterium]